MGATRNESLGARASRAAVSPTPTAPQGQPGVSAPARSVVPELQPISVTGLLATVPGYASIDASTYRARIPGTGAPQRIQLLLALTEDDEAYVVIALDTTVDRFITAGTVEGPLLPPIENLPLEMDFARGVIVADRVTLMDPMKTTPDQVNQDPEAYAFKRVTMDTTYVFSGVRIKDAPPSLDHIGFGAATDRLGSQSRDDYLTIVDPYNTETQIRVANLTGTALFPTDGTRRLLDQLYRFAPDGIEEILNRPSVFYETLVDDDAQLLNIEDLVPTPNDPSAKLDGFHGETVSVQGVALGEMVRTEENVPILQDLPVHVTVKAMGVVDLTGAMPILGISSEDVSGAVFGFFRVDLSVYSLGDNQTVAFLIHQEAVPLDPITEVDRASFGDRVQVDLSDYLVVETEAVELTSGLALDQVDLLLPTNKGNPIVMTRHPDLSQGDFLSTLEVDGFLIDGRLLGVPEDLTDELGPEVVVAAAGRLSFQKGVLQVSAPAPTVMPQPTPGATPEPIATTVPTYSLSVSVEPAASGTVTSLLSGGVYVAGTNVTLTALPAPGFAFDHWSGDVSGAEVAVVVTMDGDRALTAHFKVKAPLPQHPVGSLDGALEKESVPRTLLSALRDRGGEASSNSYPYSLHPRGSWHRRQHSVPRNTSRISSGAVLMQGPAPQRSRRLRLAQARIPCV